MTPNQYGEVLPSPRKVVPFPLSRRRDLVARLAAQMADRSAESAEKHLQLQLRRQTDVLRRKPLPEPIIVEQVRGLENAVRAELWRLVMAPSHHPGGAA